MESLIGTSSLSKPDEEYMWSLFYMADVGAKTNSLMDDELSKQLRGDFYCSGVRPDAEKAK